MSWVSKILAAIKGNQETAAPHVPLLAPQSIGTIPTVKFDPRRVTKSVEEDLRASIESFDEFDPSHVPIIYAAALKSTLAGGNRALLYQAIIDLGLPQITKSRAREITTFIANRATAQINQEHQISLGITSAIWASAGAPCMVNPKKPTKADVARDREHKLADGKRYDVKTGMFLNGRWTIPGRDPGCKCSSSSIIPGLARGGDGG
jgi:hypothetical protein